MLDEKESWKKDPLIQSGFAWLANHFTVDTTPNCCNSVRFYYLYAVERAGILYGTETIGKHEWYPAGAKAILDAQKPDGSWLAWPKDKESFMGGNPGWDTCFAILFLRRAARPLERPDVATEDRYLKK
jgi:hypothetical protein